MSGKCKLAACDEGKRICCFSCGLVKTCKHLCARIVGNHIEDAAECREFLPAEKNEERE